MNGTADCGVTSPAYADAGRRGVSTEVRGVGVGEATVPSGGGGFQFYNEILNDL